MWRLRVIVASLIIAISGAASAPAVADTDELCFKATLETKGDNAIRLCGSFISSKKPTGQTLARALNNRGLGHMKNNQLDRAMEDFNHALRISPKYVFALDNRADVWRLKGQLDRAIADYNEVIRIDPKFASAYVNRGQAFADLKNFESARADYRTALAQKGDRAIDNWARKRARTLLDELDAKAKK